MHAVAKLPKSYRVLEVFSGMSEVTMQAVHRPSWEALQPFELTFGDDPRAAGLPPRDRFHGARLRRPGAAVRPLVSAAVAQRPGEGGREAGGASSPLALHATRAERAGPPRRLGADGTAPHFVGLALPEMRARPHLCRAIRDQCQDGLCDPVLRKPYRKRTALD